MKQGFFAFTPGLAGAGLLLLRGSVACFLFTISSKVQLEYWVSGVFFLCAALIISGLCTRIIACAAGLIYLVVVWKSGWGALLPSFTGVVDAGVLVLVGPGAFSIDARLFGRRTIHLAA